MKKLIIPAALLLIAACVQPFMKEKSTGANVIATGQAHIPVTQKETTRSFAASSDTGFSPHFTALNIPQKMKQDFRINPKSSQVIIGKSGTMVLIPENAFKDANGNVVNGKVKMEIVEGIKDADIIKMNLGTMSDQGPLETGGMIYINAFSENGDSLKLADGKKLDVEIPTDNKKTGMKLWNGIVQKDGSVSWTNPQPLKENLRPVPAISLEKNSGGKAEKKQESTDNVIMLRSKEYLWEQWWDVKNHRWVNDRSGATSDTNIVAVASADGKSTELVNLADKKFENTNIATAEFRSRIPFINQACDSRLILCYTENPQRALWKSDNAAADSLEKSGCELADLFRQFAKMKQGKVDPADPNTVAALDAAREKALENYEKNVRESSHAFDQKYPAYASYSFGMKTLGWANVDRLCGGNATPMFFNVHVDGTKDDDVQATLIVPGRNLFINGYKRPNGDYSFTHGEYEQQASYPAGEEAYVLAKSGNGKNLRFELKKIILGTNQIENVSLHAGTDDELAVALGNNPPEKDEPEKKIDDWYLQSLKSGAGCLCGSEDGRVGWNK